MERVCLTKQKVTGSMIYQEFVCVMISRMPLWRFPNTGEIPLLGSRRSKTPYFIPENSKQWWLPEPEPETVPERPHFKIEQRLLPDVIQLCVQHSKLDHVSPLHLPTHSVPPLSTVVWWMIQSWLQGVMQGASISSMLFVHFMSNYRQRQTKNVIEVLTFFFCSLTFRRHLS